jgi:hypothetical protein
MCWQKPRLFAAKNVMWRGLAHWRGLEAHVLNPFLGRRLIIFSSLICQVGILDSTVAMLTGVETAGIVLAILPLVVNQLDAYVQGLETIKTFRTKRYRRELESYLTRLGTQHAIFLNTLEQLLEDVADSDDEVRDLIGNPTGPLWQDTAFQAKLRKRLGRDHDIYIKTTTILSRLLQNLSDKLGLESNIVGRVRAANFVPTFYPPLMSCCNGDRGISRLTIVADKMARCRDNRTRSQEVQRHFFKVCLCRAAQ